MRCSSCEAALDEFLESTLPPKRMAQVAAHLRRCPHCDDLHSRLRIVDGLLNKPPEIDLPSHFTANLMLEVRTMPQPVPLRRAVLPFTLFYLVAAWIAAIAALAFVRPGGPAVARAAWSAIASAFGAIAHGTHAFWPVAPVAASLVIGVLSIDAVLFVAILLFYRSVRPQLAARLALSRETP